MRTTIAVFTLALTLSACGTFGEQLFASNDDKGELTAPSPKVWINPMEMEIVDGHFYYTIRVSDVPKDETFQVVLEGQGAPAEAIATIDSNRGVQGIRFGSELEGGGFELEHEDYPSAEGFAPGPYTMRVMRKGEELASHSFNLIESRHLSGASTVMVSPEGRALRPYVAANRLHVWVPTTIVKPLQEAEVFWYRGDTMELYSSSITDGPKVAGEDPPLVVLDALALRWPGEPAEEYEGVLVYEGKILGSIRPVAREAWQGVSYDDGYDRHGLTPSLVKVSDTAQKDVERRLAERAEPGDRVLTGSPTRRGIDEQLTCALVANPEAAELQQGIHALKLEQEMAMEGYERDDRVIKSRYSTAAEKKSARAANQRRLNAAGQYVSRISAKNKKLEAIRVSYSSGCLTQYFPPSYRALWE